MSSPKAQVQAPGPPLAVVVFTLRIPPASWNLKINLWIPSGFLVLVIKDPSQSSCACAHRGPHQGTACGQADEGPAARPDGGPAEDPLLRVGHSRTAPQQQGCPHNQNDHFFHLLSCKYITPQTSPSGISRGL